MTRLIVVALALVALGVGATTGGTAAVGAGCARERLRPPPPAASRPHYALTIRLAPDLGSASGTVRITFRPEVATDRIVLRLWPNGPFYATAAAWLRVGRVTANGRTVAESQPDPTMLVVRRQLAAHEAVTLSTTWQLMLPFGPGQRLHGGTYARLGSFFPLLAWDGTGWATDPPAGGPLESWTSPTSDFDVRVAAPRGLRVVASGEQIAPGRWRATAVRDFALAVGRFSIVRGVVHVPAPVRVVAAVAPGDRGTASEYLKLAASALRAHSRRFGPYPWRTFTVAAMPDTRGRFSGIEYPTLAFLLGEKSKVVVAHEAGHQWFYSLVGNDQARDPWLDESLATWAESRADGTLGDLLKVRIPPAVRDRVGEPLTFWDSLGRRTVLAGLYVGGVQALASLGDPARVDCALRRYVAQNAYRTATPRDLLAALQPFFPDARAKLTRRGVRF